MSTYPIGSYCSLDDKCIIQNDNVLDFPVLHYDCPYYADNIEARIFHLINLIRDHKDYSYGLSLVEIKLCEALFWYNDYLGSIDDD